MSLASKVSLSFQWFVALLGISMPAQQSRKPNEHNMELKSWIPEQWLYSWLAALMATLTSQPCPRLQTLEEDLVLQCWPLTARSHTPSFSFTSAVYSEALKLRATSKWKILIPSLRPRSCLSSHNFSRRKRPALPYSVSLRLNFTFLYCYCCIPLVSSSSATTFHSRIQADSILSESPADLHALLFINKFISLLPLYHKHSSFPP